jgi:hypothetical protein
VQIRQFCESLLRKPALHPQLADALSKYRARVWGSHLRP